MATIWYVYRAPTNGDWFPGVPNRDITDTEWARLSVDQRRTVKEARSQGEKVWVPIDEITETEEERLAREAAEAAAKAAAIKAARIVRGAEFDALVPGQGQVVIGGAQGPVAVPRSLPNTVVAMGDSITNTFSAKSDSYFRWATRLAGDRVRDGGVYATSGATADTIRDTHLPTVLALTPRPQFCVVLAGTNNAPNAPAAIAALTDIYTRLRDGGITPILCTLTPRTDALAFVATVNAWITRYAATHRLPLADFHSATVDPATGGWLSGYNTDTIHPGSNGAKAMGTALAPVLQAVSTPWTPPLSTTQADPTNLLPSSLFLAGFPDARGKAGSVPDGLPDGTGFTASDRFGLQFVNGETITTISYAAEPGVVTGRWLVIERTGTTPNTQIAQINMGRTTVAPGDLIAFGCRIKVEGMVAGSDVTVKIGDGFTAAPLAAPTLDALVNWKDHNVGPITYYNEARVPAGMTTIRLEIVITGPAGPKLSIGQLLIRNLTALGVA